MISFKRIASISLVAAMSLPLALGTGTAASAKRSHVTVVAQQPQDALSQMVDYADLNLASDVGARTLNSRISRAVRQVCAPLNQRHMRVDHSACRSIAWESARPQIDRAILRARELASTGTSAIPPVAIVIVTRR